MNQLNYKENLTFIQTVPLLQGLTDYQKQNLASSLIPQIFSKGQTIVTEGEDGDRLYIIKSGTVSCLKKGQEIRKLQKGDFFGEQALLYNSQRTASVIALEEVKSLYMMRDTLKQLLGSQLQQVLYRNTQRDAFRNHSLLKRLTPDQFEKLIDQMNAQQFRQHEIVLQKGSTLKNKIFIVLKGSLIKSTSKTKVAEKGQFLGLQQFLEGSNVQTDEDIIVETQSADIVFCASQQFEQCIGGSLNKVVTKNQAMNILKQIYIFHTLSDNKIQQLSEALRIQKFTDKQEIFHQNQKGDRFFIVKKGVVSAYKDNVKIRQITMHDYFGERSLIYDNLRSATIIAEGKVSCWFLEKKDFNHILGHSIRDYLIRRIEMQDENIELEQLTFIKLLGQGTFGNVSLVRHPKKKLYYALKSVSLNAIEFYKIQENIIQERQILLQIDHPFIMRLFRTQRDERRVYFLTEFVNGIDLYDTLRILGLLNNYSSLFYAASILLMMDYLHQRNIVYRDFKPENIMIDEMGYLKLIDFGTAKNIQRRTYTLAGTPHYMAPEVFLGKGYSFEADYWSLGIIIYEFFCGEVPFGENAEDPYNIYESIIQYKFHYPNHIMKSQLAAKSFIDMLLSQNPSLRNGGSMKNLKNHE